MQSIDRMLTESLSSVQVKFGSVYGLWNSWKLDNAKYEKNGGNAKSRGTQTKK